MFHDIRKLRKVQILALLVWGVASLSFFVWKAVHAQHERNLMQLYFNSRAGDLDCLSKLAADRSSTGDELLLQIAQGENNPIEVREAALAALDTRTKLDSPALVMLIGPNQPFVIRHRVAGMFQRHGCDETCISAALYALKAIEDGAETREISAINNLTQKPPDAYVEAEQLKNETTADYTALLQADPCLTRTVISEENASPEFNSFRRKLDTKLAACSK